MVIFEDATLCIDDIYFAYRVFSTLCYNISEILKSIRHRRTVICICV